MFAGKKITAGEIFKRFAVLCQRMDMQARHIAHDVKTTYFRLAGEVFRNRFNPPRINFNIEKSRNSAADFFRINDQG